MRETRSVNKGWLRNRRLQDGKEGPNSRRVIITVVLSAEGLAGIYVDSDYVASALENLPGKGLSRELKKQVGRLRKKKGRQMSKSDFIADSLTIIRNASMTRKQYADVPYSKIIESILGILKNERYIEDFKLMEYLTAPKVTNKRKSFKVYLRYISTGPALTNLKRISRPGLRIYVNKNEIPRVLRGHGTAIISTSKGLLTDEEARLQKIGGEVICYIW